MYVRPQRSLRKKPIWYRWYHGNSHEHFASQALFLRADGKLGMAAPAASPQSAHPLEKVKSRVADFARKMSRSQAADATAAGKQFAEAKRGAEALASVINRMTFANSYTEAQIQKEQQMIFKYPSGINNRQANIDRMIRSNMEQSHLLEEFHELVAGFGVSLAGLPQPVVFFIHNHKSSKGCDTLRALTSEDAESMGTLLHVVVSRMPPQASRGNFDEAKAKHIIDALVASGVSASVADAYGNTPATIAALRGCTPIKRHLLRAELSLARACT